MRFARPLLAAVASLLLTSAASAAIIPVATGFGADTATRDTATGFDWLDLLISAGNVADIDAALADPTSQLFGWRRATTAEVAQFWNNAGITVTSVGGTLVETSDPAQIAAISELMDLVGIGPEGGGSIDISIGYTAEPGGSPGRQGAAFLYRRFNFDPLAALIAAAAVTGAERSTVLSPGDNLGSWLVRDVDQVPEPESLSLIGLGLIGVALARRRK